MNDQQLTVYLAYTRRFDDLTKEWPPSLQRDAAEDAAQERAIWGKVLGQGRREMVRYFNLCSEEFYLFQQGLIELEVFAIWATQMRHVFGISVIAHLWRKSWAITIRDFRTSLPADADPNKRDALARNHAKCRRQLTQSARFLPRSLAFLPALW